MSSNIPPINGPGDSSSGVFDASLIWQANKSYQQGDNVVPTADVPQPSATPLPNDSFQAGGITGWASSGGWVGDSNPGNLFQGNTAQLPPGAGTGLTLISTTRFPVVPGQVMTAGFYCDNNVSDTSLDVHGYCAIFWYNSGGTLIGQTTFADSVSQYFTLQSGYPPPGQSWPVYAISKVSGTAPAGAATASPGCIGKNTSATETLIVEGFKWIYSTQSAPTIRYFTAIQNGAGTSGSTEPTWPTTGTVSDGSVVWEVGVTSIIRWIGININTTGATQPTWPTSVGSNVSDGNMYWQCVTPAITDTNCPHAKYVTTASSKIYCGDTDIVRFSATTNPMDWTSEADAGFLPTGLQSYGANPVTGLGLYRSNLVVFNAQAMQVWQVDEDPANMSLLDAIPIGCTAYRTLAPVNNDLFFLSLQGVRTMGISAGSTNLAAGDVGMPIDPLVQAAQTWALANSVEPLATYLPSAGQYWLAYKNYAPAAGLYDASVTRGTGTTTVFVYTMSRIGEVGAWSNYVFPFAIDDFCQVGNYLYVRAGNDVLRVDDTLTQDFVGDGRAANFNCVLQWPWLDFDEPGKSKLLDGVDVVTSATGNIAIQVGWDQTNAAAFTSSYSVSADTLPGNMVPFSVLAPTFSIKFTMSSSTDWEVQSVNVYLQDQQITS